MFFAFWVVIHAPNVATAEDVQRFALVVGNNVPLIGHGYEVLNYADDDALRFATFMQRLDAKVRLLVGPDAESAQRYPEMSKLSLAPRRDRLLDAIALLEQDLKQAEGSHREVYFYFSGHGSVTGSEAYLHLLDEPFSRTDLHTLLLERLSAERIHIIIDSCHSYFLVNNRGRRIAVQTEQDNVQRFPRAGFLLSTSAKKEVQEWSGYEAGVFSYQLLGAMQGAADVNNDRLVTYAEAHAYIVAANMGIENPAARVQPFVHRPVVGETVLVDLSNLHKHPILQIPPEVGGHFFVVNSRGQRLLDGNKLSGQPLGLSIGSSSGLNVWFGKDLYTSTSGTPILTRTATTAGIEVAARGTIADEFRKNLFLRPLTPEFVAGLDAAVAFRVEPGSTPRLNSAPPLPKVSTGLYTMGGLGLLTGAVSTAVFLSAKSTAEPDVFGADADGTVEAARRRADVSRAVLVGGFASGAAFIASAALYDWLSGEAP